MMMDWMCVSDVKNIHCLSDHHHPLTITIIISIYTYLPKNRQIISITFLNNLKMYNGENCYFYYLLIYHGPFSSVSQFSSQANSLKNEPSAGVLISIHTLYKYKMHCILTALQFSFSKFQLRNVRCEHKSKWQWHNNPLKCTQSSSSQSENHCTFFCR